MPRLTKIATLLVMIIFCALPAHAEICGYFKGEWDMTPDQIKYLHADMPIIASDFIYDGLQYDYAGISDQAVRVHYYFYDDKLYMVKMLVPDYILDSAEADTIIQYRLANRIASGKQYEYAYYENAFTDHLNVFCAAWINQDTYVQAQGLIPLDGEDFYIHVFFYSNVDDRYNAEFKNLQTLAYSNKNLRSLTFWQRQK